ncbi:hypothetical protein NMG60_11021587 [Bertholletia excelsa]
MEGGNTNEIYRECLRNHAASLGSYATDGCGEFTMDDNSAAGLQCAACGCHRNFHRKVITYGGGGSGQGGTTVEMIEYYGRQAAAAAESPESERSGGVGKQKRFRTKFTAEQKEKMLAFAEKLGWKMQRKEEEDEIERFCKGVGVTRQVFKVWMHNHKNTISPSNSATSTGNASSLTTQ